MVMIGKRIGLKTVDIYKKNLEIATNKKIQNLIEKHTQYSKKYGEQNSKTLRIGKKIDEEMQKIYNN